MECMHTRSNGFILDVSNILIKLTNMQGSYNLQIAIYKHSFICSTPRLMPHNEQQYNQSQHSSLLIQMLVYLRDCNWFDCVVNQNSLSADMKQCTYVKRLRSAIIKSQITSSPLCGKELNPTHILQRKSNTVRMLSNRFIVYIHVV